MAELPPPTSEMARVRQVVADVLSRAEYAEAGPTLWERIQTQLVRALGELWVRIAETGGGTLIGSVVLGLVVLLIAVAVWRLVRSVRRDRAQSEGLASDVGRSAADWREEAGAHEAAGRWRDGVRCRYRALIADLAARGSIQEVPGRTAGEYLTAVRDALPGVAEPFARATAVFESAWYGPVDVTESEAEQMRAASDEILLAGAAAGESQ